MTVKRRYSPAMRGITVAAAAAALITAVGGAAVASKVVGHEDAPGGGVPTVKEACLDALDLADVAFSHVTDDGRLAGVRDRLRYARYVDAERECRALLDRR